MPQCHCCYHFVSSLSPFSLKTLAFRYLFSYSHILLWKFANTHSSKEFNVPYHLDNNYQHSDNFISSTGNLLLNHSKAHWIDTLLKAYSTCWPCRNSRLHAKTLFLSLTGLLNTFSSKTTSTLEEKTHNSHDFLVTKTLQKIIWSLEMVSLSSVI